MKYILTFLSRDQPMKWYPEWGFAATTNSPDLTTATQFDTLEEAATAYEKTRAYYDGLLGLRIQGIEEVPASTRREVMELEGVVDLTDLKFAIADKDEFMEKSDAFPFGIGYAPLEEATVFNTLPEAVRAWSSERAQDFFPQGRGANPSRIVGIREVTTEPTFRVVPLG